MNIFKKAIMAYRRILEYEALKATPEIKAYNEAVKAYAKARVELNNGK